MPALIVIPLGETSPAEVERAVRTRFADKRIEWLDRQALLRRLPRVLSRRYAQAVLVAPDLAQPRLTLTSLVLGLVRAREHWRIDLLGRAERFSASAHLRQNAWPITRHLLGCGLALSLAYPLLICLRAVLRPRRTEHVRPRRLLYLRSQFWLGLQGGGSVAHTAGVIDGLRQAGVELDILSSDRLTGVDLPHIIVPPTTWFDGMLREAEELAYNVTFLHAALRRHRPEAIYQRHTAFNVVGAVLSRWWRVPFILEFNSSEVWKGRHWGGVHLMAIASLVEQINLRAADKVIVVSRPLREQLIGQGIAAHRVLVNPNGVDPTRFQPDDDGTAVCTRLGLESAVVVCFSGTFGVWHGIPTLAAALPKVLAARPDVRCVLLGDGPLRHLVENLDKRVLLTGLVPHAEVPSYLAAADILVSPHGRQVDGGEFFGSPTKLFEYMAAGRAIVASAVGQIGEVLEDDVTAVLVPPEDPEALCAAIVRLVDDACLRARLGAAARATAEAHHTWRQNAERLLASLGGSHPEPARGIASMTLASKRTSDRRVSSASLGVTVSGALARLRRTPPRRLPGVAGRYALRTARQHARRWHIQRNRGELSDLALHRALGGSIPEQAFDAFVKRFFVDPVEARQRAQALVGAYPELAQRTRQAADQALDHIVDLLGSGPTQLGERIDWHIDFKVGIGWPPSVLADDQDYLRLGEPCDVKMPWELSRCHHWVALGRAYALDGDPHYAAEFVEQLAAWLDDNPWPYGVNWGRAMEVAVRAVNWLWAAALFAGAPEFTPVVKARLLKALLQHGRHIASNLEYSDNNGNHYLSNGVGLLFLGVLLPEIADAPAWRRTGEEIVWGEIERQVHADGVDFEQGIGYQGLVLEFWYSCVLLCQRNGIAVPLHVLDRLQRMFEFTHAYTRPDGTFPQMGDNDDGRLAGIDDEPPGSHCRHLAVGAAMFDRPDWLAAAGDAVETSVWLVGPSVLGLPCAPATHTSTAFEQGGFYVLRSDEAVMVVDVGEVGMRGIGGHGHNDVLSFDLWAAGAPLLVDSGTYTYTADPVARQAMRSIAAHNALRVDGEETSRLGGERWLWQIANDAHPRLMHWSSDADRDTLEAEHDGYRRLSQPIMHRRRISFDKRSMTWEIEDVVDGRGEHLVELFFHPAVTPLMEEHAVRLTAPRGDLLLVPPKGTLVRQEHGWISRAYGQREPSTVLVYAVRAPLPARFTTMLALVPPGTPSDALRSVVQS
ncbi:MAG TPA: heparinase II/III family protein [Chloroflexota bacterium]